jgi:hypothetical protein
MSAVPADAMREPLDKDREAGTDSPLQKFWHWFALGALVFCWIAEATMCADRGF